MEKHHSKMNSQHGQSIIEILIATAIISVTLVAALALGTNSIKSSTYSRNLNQATKYSYEAVDYMRQLRHTQGWGNISTLNLGVYCLNTIPNLILPSSGSCSTPMTNEVFTRELKIEDTSSDGIIKFKVTTTWEEAGGTKKAEIKTIISRWN